MRVIGLETENFKRIVAIKLAPNGNLVEIAGKNASGKSSLLESMIVALGGKEVIPSKPIRKGERSATIVATLGDGKKIEFIVKRTFASKEDGSYTTQVTVENGEGASYKSPQTLLDGIRGTLTFDPFAFTRKKPAEQLQDLRRLVPAVDFNAIDAANRGDYERRAGVNRQLRQLEARLATLPVPGDTRHERINEQALVDELARAGDKAAEIEKERARRQDLMRSARSEAATAETYRREAQQLRDRVEELKEEIADLESKAAKRDEYAATRDAESKKQQAEAEALPPLEAPPDTTELSSQIQQARLRNAAVDERERAIAERERVKTEVDQLAAQSEGYTAAIAKRDTDKAAAVAAANLPVEGLSFGADEVLLNGLPFEQASGAEKLRVSIAIGAAMNPKLRVMFVHDGSLLDDEGLQLLAEFAEKHDFQVWLERVASDAKVGVIIEDGMLKAASEVAA